MYRNIGIIAAASEVFCWTTIVDTSDVVFSVVRLLLLLLLLLLLFLLLLLVFLLLLLLVLLLMLLLLLLYRHRDLSGNGITSLPMHVGKVFGLENLQAL